MAIADVGDIQCTGDSITRGYQNPFGTRGCYREWLQDFFVAADITYNFVGSEDFSRDGLTDGDCQAISGYTLQNVRDNFADDFATYEPDYVLMVIGTNNWSEAEDQDFYEARYGEVFDAVFDNHSSAKLLISTVPRAGNYRLASTGALNLSTRNAEYTIMDAAVSALVAAESRAYQVDISSIDWDLGTGSGDGVHLNKYGHKVVARAFFDQILTIEGIDNATIDNIKRMADVTSVNGYGASF